MRNWLYVIGGLLTAGLLYRFLNNTDDIHEDARRHRIRQLNRMGDQDY